MRTARTPPRQGRPHRRRAVLLAALSLLLLPASAGAQAVGEEDKARGRPAVASSSHEPGDYPFSAACALRACAPERAVDGDRATRWASERADGQWWQVDLGAVRLVDRVLVDWEEAYAPRYLVGTSLDGMTFTAAEDAVAGAGPHATAFPAREARWVRITGLERRSFPSGRRAGISFWSVGVFGPVEPPPVVQAAAPPAPAPPPRPRRRAGGS